jgi:hypothetical protein
MKFMLPFTSWQTKISGRLAVTLPHKGTDKDIFKDCERMNGRTEMQLNYGNLEGQLYWSWGVAGHSKSVVPGRFLLYIRTFHLKEQVSSFKTQDLGAFQRWNPKSWKSSAYKFIKGNLKKLRG